MSCRTMVLTLITCFVALGCEGSPLPRTDQDTAQADSTQSTEERGESIGRPEPVPPSAETRGSGADSAPAERMAVPTQEADSLPLVSIQDVVAGNVKVGSRVRVRGTCIGYSRVLAAGPQPQTRSDWQVVSDSTAIWVVGSYPPGCEATTPAAGSTIFVVEVAEDTLPALGTRPARSRRYLVHVIHQDEPSE